MSSAAASAISPPEPGHAPTRPLARCSATRCSGRSARPSRTRDSSLWRGDFAVVRLGSRLHAGLARPAALLGFCPSQVFSRVRVARAFLSDRAHVPLAPPRPPRFIFVGVTGRRLETRMKIRKAADRGREWFGLLGFAPVCGPFPRHARSAVETILPWALPLAGLRARQPCIAIGLDPDRIIRPRRPTPALSVRPRFSNPLMGLTASFPTETWPIENCSVSHIPVCVRMLPDA